MDWDSVFAGYRSAVDWSAACFWRDLADAYPDAKVVLTVRDPRRWYNIERFHREGRLITPFDPAP
ncbi:sulfotransferase [Sphaerisporangium sp. NPDC051017]|uniref:sulfotransferase n=1 Tax=Sphaerisporangium sp. NPDC051017 TaxID=3154636 RepID=UPI0034204261